MKTRTVLVSGAGIAGPALAFWLHRHGFVPTVVEVAPAVRPGGQTVDLRGAGRTVVERMGLMPTVRAACVDQRGMAYVDAAGRHLAEMSVDALDGDGIVSEIEILRGDLADVLVGATRDDVEYLFGVRVVTLEQRPDDVVVTLSDGTVRPFDLVVGADGPHSGTRRVVFGPEGGLVHRLGGYMSWFTAPDHLGLDGWFAMYNEPGRVASMRPDTAPGRAKAGLSFLSDPCATTAPTSTPSAGSSRSGSPTATGWSRPWSRRCSRRTTSTSTTSPRCTWTGGAPAASRSSATPGTARRR
jgi:2-polyprenyl-6-methoxyphenol hydroxylase-like FAD-dependent oxidoreductase